MRVYLTLSATVLALAAACAPVPQTTQPAASNSASVLPDAGFDAALNDLRAAHGLRPARPDPRLAAAAQGHARDMARSGSTSHRGSDGKSHVERIRAQGYATYYPVENLAWDWASPTRAAAEWARSPTHSANMLLSGDVEYGLGQVDRVYVLVLARRC